jgi:hypothetical protein
MSAVKNHVGDPYVFEPPGSVNTRYGSGSFYHEAKIVKLFIPAVF